MRHYTCFTLDSVPWRIIQSLNSHFKILCASALFHMANTRACVHAHTHTHTHTQMYTQMHMCIYAHTQAQREREREREREIIWTPKNINVIYRHVSRLMFTWGLQYENNLRISSPQPDSSLSQLTLLIQSTWYISSCWLMKIVVLGFHQRSLYILNINIAMVNVNILISENFTSWCQIAFAEKLFHWAVKTLTIIRISWDACCSTDTYYSQNYGC